MSNRYAPLSNNPNIKDVDDELEAAFDYSDDEDASESHPLNPSSTSRPHTPVPAPHVPGTYDFNTEYEYDYPPPGSPPRPSAIALPNDHGNSNGITSFTVDSSVQTQRRGWFGRTAASVLPTHYVQRFGIGQQAVPSGVVGGGNNMDGVFANVTAKPTRAVMVQDGENTYMVPEESQNEAPPSYASAQADSVPPYWETTVHAPFSPDAFGEVVVDSLPTGSVFSFLWNMLVSISFQFIGFLLTYLLHTTHAARLGSRAGLGVTLIQFGFTLRANLDGKDGSDGNVGGGGDWPGWVNGDTSESELINNLTHNGTLNSATAMASDPDGNVSYMTSAGIATNEWLSFFLMTIGWFILLTSLLGFWRVKRWERGILVSQQPSTPPSTADQITRSRAVLSNIESTFGISILSGRDFRAGLGFGSRSRDNEREYVVHESAAAGRTEEPATTVPTEEGSPSERELRAAHVALHDERLRNALQASGLL